MLHPGLAGRPIPYGALRVARHFVAKHKLMACALRVDSIRGRENNVEVAGMAGDAMS